MHLYSLRSNVLLNKYIVKSIKHNKKCLYWVLTKHEFLVHKKTITLNSIHHYINNQLTENSGVPTVFSLLQMDFKTLMKGFLRTESSKWVPSLSKRSGVKNKLYLLPFWRGGRIVSVRVRYTACVFAVWRHSSLFISYWHTQDSRWLSRYGLHPKCMTASKSRVTVDSHAGQTGKQKSTWANTKKVKHVTLLKSQESCVCFSTELIWVDLFVYKFCCTLWMFLRQFTLH